MDARCRANQVRSPGWRCDREGHLSGRRWTQVYCYSFSTSSPSSGADPVVISGIGYWSHIEPLIGLAGRRYPELITILWVTRPFDHSLLAGSTSHWQGSGSPATLINTHSAVPRCRMFFQKGSAESFAVILPKACLAMSFGAVIAMETGLFVNQV